LGTLGTLSLGAADLLWPLRCAACDLEVLPRAPLCASCADTLLDCAGATQVPSFRRPAAWTAAACRFEFGGQLAVALRRAKYGQEAVLARQLGALLRPLPAACDLVVPVPLHPRRFRGRGFNQAAELVRGAGARPILGVLIRTRDTPPQTERPRSLRLRNVARAFAVPAPEMVHGKRVLLVDDVMTTGATADACAQALLAAGAASVCVLCLARAPA
jgi:ComF family protein